MELIHPTTKNTGQQHRGATPNKNRLLPAFPKEILPTDPH